MNIFLTIPDFSLHGGIRIIVEWANRLTRWHRVLLYPLNGAPHGSGAFDLDPRVEVVNLEALTQADLVVLTSPHSIHLARYVSGGQRVVLFLQMAEHLFKPLDRRWQQRCREFYLADYPMISISRWNIELLGREFGRTGTCYHVGNGVNLDDFPLELPDREGNVVLVEGWESLNPSKDPQHVGPRVAARLRRQGYRILAYSQVPLHTLPHVPHEYHVRPSLDVLNDLYRRATVLLKASRYDARACAPVEAMTKGTPTSRAIILGDDDLLHEHNALRCAYGVDELHQQTLRLLQTPELYLRLADNCHAHLRQNGWDTWMPIINDLLCNA